jgi:ADP-ribose pyrophosphatase YjhB (NUDIX family)
MKDTILTNRSGGFRAGGIVIKDGKMLFMHQIVNGEDFYTIPGGSWEKGETLEETCKREIQEEFSIDVDVKHLLFLIDTHSRIAFYFLCDYVSGEIELGGPEKSRMNESEQYYVEWIDLERISTLNLIPSKAREALQVYLENNKTELFLLVEK